MRALILVTDTRRGGTPLRLASVARGLRGMDWEIAFVSVMPGGPVLDQLAEDGFDTHSLSLSTPRHALRALRDLRKLIADHRPDVIQTALWHANVLGRVAAWGTGVPVVSGYQSVDLDKPRFRVVADRVTARSASAHVCVSRAVSSMAQQRERIPAAKVSVIPTGRPVLGKTTEEMRRESRALLGIPEGSKVVGWVGRMHPVKDLPTLIRAAARLPEWWVLLVGEGEAFDGVNDLVRSSGLAERTVFVGGRDRIEPYLRALDVFALSSLWEGSPGALLEAMSAGLPVVATRIDGVAEIISDGINGILVDVGDHRAMAAAIEKAVSHPELGERAVKTVGSNFSLEKMIRSYDELWREITVE